MPPLSGCVWWGGFIHCERQRSWWHIYFSTAFCHHFVSAYSPLLWGLWVLLYSVLFVRHARDRGARLKVSGLNEPPRLDGSVCECALLWDSGRILWYKAVSLRSLCSHTRDALFFPPRVGWRGWGRVGGGGGDSMLGACFLNCRSCFTNVVSSGKSYGEHNRKTITWKQLGDIHLLWITGCVMLL